MKKIITGILLTLGSIGSYAQVTPSDSLALVEIYQSTSGAGWTHHENWLSGPVPTWFGVTVNSQRVTKLELCADCYIGSSGNNLIGPIPSAIGDLTALTNVVLSGNKLTGSIPTEIGNLTNLYWLDLSANQLDGSLPASLGNLVHLNSLLLSFNMLDGELPAELGNLTSLEHLSLGWNRLTGSIPTEIGDLAALTQLQLARNQFTGSIPKEIGKLINLIDLSLEINQLSGEIPVEIGNPTGLRSLSLHSNNLGGNIPKEIGNLTNLNTLLAYSNQLTGNLPHEIGQLTSLVSFAVYNNQLSGALPAEIGNLTNLTLLSIYNNQFSGNLPSEIGNLVNLRNLALSDNLFSGTLPSSLGSLTNLDLLDVSNNQFVGVIPSSLGNLSIARYLVLSNNDFSGAVPFSLSSLPALEYLSLEGNELTDLPDLSGNTQLWHLTLQGNHFTFEDIEPNVAISGVSYLPQQLNFSAPDQHLTEGDTFAASFTVAGSFNQYQWWKDGVLVAGAQQPNLTIPSVTLADAGTYRLRITNTKVTDMLLVTEPLFLSVAPSPRGEVHVASDTTSLVNFTDWAFPKVVTGDSVTTAFSVSNTGTAPLVITSINVGSDFTVSFVEALPFTLVPGASMKILCRYKPASDGTVIGNLSISNDTTVPVFVVHLAGTSFTPPPTFPEMEVSSDSTLFANNDEFIFPELTTGQSTEAKLVLANSGSAPMIVSSITASGDFSVDFSAALPVTIAAGTSVDFVCRFTSTTAGKMTGYLSILANTSQPIFQLRLVATVTDVPQPPVTVIKKPRLVVVDGSHVVADDSDLAFPVTSTTVGQLKRLDISNEGDTVLTIQRLEATGDFVVSPADLMTLQPGEHQIVNLEFRPSQDGERMGLLTIVSNADSLSHVIKLHGTGFTEKRHYVVMYKSELMNSADVAYEITEVGNELVKEVVLVNTGNTSISIESIDVSGPFSVASSINGVLNTGDHLLLQVVFTPDHIGEHVGSLTIKTDSDTPIVTLGLKGTGEAEIEVYNMVTTRANGANDFLEIRNIGLFPSNHVQVFDRWGNRVYSKLGYDNINDTFRGVSDKGNALPDGTYYYLIDKKNGSEQVTGFLVVRN